MNLSVQNMPALGVGITYSAVLEPLFLLRPDLFDVIEVEPQTIWRETHQKSDPYKISDELLNHIESLPGRKLVHSVGVPVGGSVRPDPTQLTLLKQTINRFGSPWISEHLSFNTTPEFSTGFFLPARQTPAGIQTVVTAIRDLQIGLPVPVAVETGVNYLRPRKDEMSDGIFTAEVIKEANCGLLLDLHNLFANALNGRQSVEAFLKEIPLDRVWEVHLAGGMEMDGFYLDSHSGAMPDMLLAIARDIIPNLPNLKAIIFEIFPSFVEVVGLPLIQEQVEKLHQLWANRNQDPKPELPSVSLPISVSPQFDNVVDPLEWEQILGSLVIGRLPQETNFSLELAEDPGIALVRRLIHEFRASMIVNVLRLTARLLMLSLGVNIFWKILEDFWSKNPPHQFASSEAEAFAAYLKQIDLKVPQLLPILEFEQSVMHTLIDEKTRLVKFSFDPLPLLRSLAEGHLPEIQAKPGNFEIEITADGPVSATGLSLESLRSIFRFH